MRNTCTIELKHHIYDNCFFRKSRDAKTGTMSIQVYRIGETGYADPLLTVTENLGPQAPRHVAIKNYAENEGILSSLQKLGIVKKVVTRITTGYISFPVCEIDEEILNKYVA